MLKFKTCWDNEIICHFFLPLVTLLIKIIFEQENQTCFENRYRVKARPRSRLEGWSYIAGTMDRPLLQLFPWEVQWQPWQKLWSKKGQITKDLCSNTNLLLHGLIMQHFTPVGVRVGRGERKWCVRSTTKSSFGRDVTDGVVTNRSNLWLACLVGWGWWGRGLCLILWIRMVGLSGDEAL